jgi:hypothetical protein
MTNKLTHIGDVKVGRVKGNSKIYPQLRLPSQYAELAGKKASIYEISGLEGDIAFIIRFDGHNHVAAYYEDTQPEGFCVANGREVPVKPCRGFQLLTSEAFLKHSWVTSGAE